MTIKPGDLVENLALIREYDRRLRPTEIPTGTLGVVTGVDDIYVTVMFLQPLYESITVARQLRVLA